MATTKRRNGAARRAAGVLPPELAQIEKDANDAVTSEGQDDYVLGATWNRLKRCRRQLKQAGFDTPDEFWDQRVPARVDARMARLLGRLVERFAPAAFILAVTVLNRFLTYCTRAGIEPLADPRQQTVRVPQEGGVFADVPLSQCTREDVQAAIAAISRPGKPTHLPQLPTAARTLVAKAAEKIGPVIAAGAHFSARMKGNAPVCTLADVPLPMMRQAYRGVLDALDGADRARGA